MSLNQNHINQLKIIYNKQKINPSLDLRVEYYTLLSSYGIAYGDLALGVVRNDTFSGQIANSFLDSSEINSGDKLSLSKDLFLKDFEDRQALFEKAIANGYDENPGDFSIEVYREYHRQVYSKYGIDLKYWTPEIPIQILGNEAGEILFGDANTVTKVYEVFELAYEQGKIEDSRFWRWLVKTTASATHTDESALIQLISLKWPKVGIALGAAILAVRGLDYFLPYCFTAETPILMSDGTYKRIADIKIGDEVMAFEGLGQLKPCKVIATSKTLDQEVVQLGNIKVTPNHQFLLPDGSFKSIKEVNSSDYLVGVTGKLIAHPGIKSVPEKHTVYNITVDRLHTYIAGDYRVHNDCIEFGDIITNQEVLANGTIVYTGENISGSKLTIVETYDPINRQINTIERKINFISGEAFVTNRWSRADGQIDSDNNAIGDPEIEVAFPFAVITGEQIGATFGSTIGQSLAGDNVFAQIGTSSVLSTVLSNVGETLHIYFNDSPVRDIPGSQSPSLEQSAEIAIQDFGDELFAEIKAQSISAISSFLVAELSDALNVGDDFGGQLFSSVSGSVTRTVISNALNPNATSLFTGLGSGIVTSVSGFIGNYLAKEIISPETTAGAIGASIGSALGSTVGFGLSAWGGATATAAANALGITVGQTLGFAGSLSSWGLFGNIFLPGIGAFIGTALGTLLGDTLAPFISKIADDVFGQDPPRAEAWINYDPLLGKFISDPTGRQQKGGQRETAVEIAKFASDALNAYLEGID